MSLRLVGHGAVRAMVMVLLLAAAPAAAQGPPAHSNAGGNGNGNANGLSKPRPDRGPPFSTAPEPATAILVGTGLAGLGLLRRRMQRRT